MRSFALCATIASLLASAATATSAINTTGMGDWTRPAIEGLVERTDYTERHVLYGVYDGTAWAELSFEQRHGTYAVAEVLRNPDAEHRWELIKITSLNDTDAFYTAGYAEALATHVGMFNFWFNRAQLKQPDSSDPRYDKLHEMVDYLRHYPHQDTAYRRLVPQLMRQIDGLWAGWEAAYRASGSPEDMADFSWESVFFVSYSEDFENFPKPTYKSPSEHKQQRNTGGAVAVAVDAPRVLPRPTHCTSVHKLTPDGELFVGHASEDTYTCMIRQMKTYVFSGGRNVTMSGYPGVICSQDDFVFNGHGILVTSTSLLNYNDTNIASYALFAVPGMFGTMIASYLAETPTQWAQLYATDDAGTYSSMFMITDMRAAHAAQLSNTTLPPGTFVVLEAIPTLAHFEDMTAKLVHDGVWFSFDIAYFNVTRQLAGLDNTYRHGMLDYSTSQYVRSPRRDMHFVTNATTMFYAMRHNNWPHDPAQTTPKCTAHPCAMNISRTPMFGTAPRGDLLPDDIDDFDFAPDTEGGVDAKVTSASMLFADPRYPTFIVQNGPTSVQQAPFSFDDFYAKYPEQRHSLRGMPDTWDFPPAMLTSHAHRFTMAASGDGSTHATAGIVLASVGATIALAVIAVGGFVVLQRRKRRSTGVNLRPASESSQLI